jgi:hypothetical protein
MMWKESLVDLRLTPYSIERASRVLGSVLAGYWAWARDSYLWRWSELAPRFRAFDDPRG